MRTRSYNPFLPASRSIRWRTGPAAGSVGLPPAQPVAQASAPVAETIVPASDVPVYTKDPRGRKPKDRSQKSRESQPRKPVPAEANETFIRAYPCAGTLNFGLSAFLMESSFGWGSNLDMLALAHGPVGCGAFAQSARLNMHGFVQGIESFTALHACTDLKTEDLEDGGDKKLGQALTEMQSLFPLARGVAILNEDPIGLIDHNVKAIAKAKTSEWGKPILPPSSPWASATAVTQAASFKTAAKYFKASQPTSYDVALPFYRTTPGLLWIASKLLREIGLNPVHIFTGSSTSDMARVHQCKFIIGFIEGPNFQNENFIQFHAQRYRQWFSALSPIWTCFLSPSATNASLRAVAAHFDRTIQRRAAQVISLNQDRVESVIARYRPHLEGKLVLVLDPIPETQLEAFRLLGVRVGNMDGWPGKTGVWRNPRLVCDHKKPSQKAIDSYIAEAKPDLVIHDRRNEYDWRKRALPGLALSPFIGFDEFPWAYDGFACFAATLDRTVNAPWRKLVKPPWPDSG